MIKQASIETLAQEYKLPAGWQGPEVYRESVNLAGMELEIVGCAASSREGLMALGSSCSERAHSDAGAFFEMLERAVALDCFTRVDARFEAAQNPAKGLFMVSSCELFPSATADMRYAISNGVAVHTSQDVAMKHAALELIERDRLLRSWLGCCSLSIIEPAPATWMNQLNHCYEFVCAEVASTQSEDQLSVIAFFGFPLDASNPLVCGYGAGYSQEDAIQKAYDEALQRLAFLWGEALPEQCPEFSPTPDYHQEYYLCQSTHHSIRKWLDGDYLRRAKTDLSRPCSLDSIVYANITPEDLAGRVWVYKAFSKDALALWFGSPPGHYLDADDADKIHPIS